MKEEYKNLSLHTNNTDHRFEMKVDTHLAFIEYNQRPGLFELLHTQVPPELEGKGVGTAIIEKTLEYLEQHRLKVIPSCPFVAAYIARHPEWNRIVADA